MTSLHDVTEASDAATAAVPACVKAAPRGGWTCGGTAVGGVGRLPKREARRLRSKRVYVLEPDRYGWRGVEAAAAVALERSTRRAALMRRGETARPAEETP